MIVEYCFETLTAITNQSGQLFTDNYNCNICKIPYVFSFLQINKFTWMHLSTDFYCDAGQVYVADEAYFPILQILF